MKGACEYSVITDTIQRNTSKIVTQKINTLIIRLGSPAIVEKNELTSLFYLNALAKRYQINKKYILESCPCPVKGGFSLLIRYNWLIFVHSWVGRKHNATRDNQRAYDT
jgi:hypothetical protein